MTAVHEMNPAVRIIVVPVSAVLVLGAAAVFLLPHLRTGTEYRPPARQENENGIQPGGESDKPDTRRSSKASRSVRTDRNNTKSFADSEKAKFDVGEMRNEAEDWLRKFRGTPEERREIVEKLRDDTELILLIGDAMESSIEEMSPDELEKERADFERNYRAQLDYLKSGRLQRMLKTTEEQEVIGSAFEAAQDFLERLDAALNAAGY